MSEKNTSPNFSTNPPGNLQEGRPLTYKEKRLRYSMALYITSDYKYNEKNEIVKKQEVEEIPRKEYEDFMLEKYGEINILKLLGFNHQDFQQPEDEESEGDKLVITPTKTTKPEKQKPLLLFSNTVLKKSKTKRGSLVEDKTDGQSKGSTVKVKPNKRRYICKAEGCNKAFTSAYGLRYHMQHGHKIVEDNEKKYVCEVSDCGKRYKNPNGLKYHKKKEHFFDVKAGL